MYARVEGTENTLVKVGSKDEYLYFKVMKNNTSQPGYEHANKTFYMSPADYPGYKRMMSTINGRKIIENFYLKRNKYLSQQNPDYEIL